MPLVIPETLFVQIPKQVIWLHADIGPMKAALQKAPEVLHRVGMDVAVHELVAEDRDAGR
jgi:hypothetical protein